MDGALVGGTTAKRFASEGGGGDGDAQHHYTQCDQKLQSRFCFVFFCFEIDVVVPVFNQVVVVPVVEFVVVEVIVVEVVIVFVVVFDVDGVKKAEMYC